MTAPMRQMALPSLPNVPSSSLRKYDPSTAPISTASAPSGVTKMAGANAYAAKLQISPATTRRRKKCQSFRIFGQTTVFGGGDSILHPIPAHHMGFLR